MRAKRVLPINKGLNHNPRSALSAEYIPDQAHFAQILGKYSFHPNVKKLLN